MGDQLFVTTVLLVTIKFASVIAIIIWKHFDLAENLLRRQFLHPRASLPSVCCCSGPQNTLKFSKIRKFEPYWLAGQRRRCREEGPPYGRLNFHGENRVTDDLILIRASA